MVGVDVRVQSGLLSPTFPLRSPTKSLRSIVLLLLIVGFVVGFVHGFDPHKMEDGYHSVDMQNEAASIATNDYSIVSKRSVEKIYTPDDPAFLKPFVPKFKRRAPLINRGYWLRTKAIESKIVRFLSRYRTRPKVVVNLGCGYDPLPFRMRHKPLAVENIRFIDVDFADLIHRKLNIVTQDNVFSPYLAKDQYTELNCGDAYIADFGWYCLVGCDLGDINTLSRVFEDVIDVVDAEILFVAEVSITYMPLYKADSLLQWTASHKYGEISIRR
jgi:tRNA wybutosine-synthesizing protein 4